LSLKVLKLRKMATLLVTIQVISLLLASSAFAKNCQLNLPEDPVTMAAVYGTDSYFDITLSDVPENYDVSNGVYNGWCIDSDVIMDQTTAFSVMLYSSCTPPNDLDSIEWDKVNYILNNKPGTATRLDIQFAIWYYANLEVGWVPQNTAGWTQAIQDAADAIVADAEANGDGFVPETGEVVAVICYPEGIDYYDQRGSYVQMTIIELPIGGGKVTGGGQIEIPRGKASFGFNAMWFSRNAVPNGEIEFINHVTGDKVHAHPLTYLIVYTPNEGNKPWPMLDAYFEGTCTVNHVEGYTFWVHVQDNAEPKNPDSFEIKVFDGDGIIVLDVSYGNILLTGNIQIHKPPK
jgi:hypothetical protein